MFKRKRPKQDDVSSSATSNSFSDIEALCDRLCVAFDPGRHATRDVKSEMTPSDRLIRTLRTLLRVSRHRRQKIEQSVQAELSTSADLRAAISELNKQTGDFDQRLAECEGMLTQHEETLATKPATDQPTPSVAPSANISANESPLLTVDNNDLAEATLETNEDDTPASLDCDDSTSEACDDEIIDLDPATAIPPIAFDDDGIDFNALVEHAIDEIADHDQGESEEGSLGGLEAFESTIRDADAALAKPAKLDADDATIPSATETSQDVQAVDERPVADNTSPTEDKALADALASIDSACLRAQSVNEELQTAITAAESRYQELTTLNDTLAAQLARRENLLARVDHELRERQIILVTDIMRAEAEHLSLTEVLEGITRSVQSMTEDITQIDCNSPSDNRAHSDAEQVD